MHSITSYASPLGTLTLASDGAGLVGLWNDGQKYFGATLKGEAPQNDSLPVFTIVRAWLDDYFAGRRPAISRLPLAPAGSEFRRAVWEILCQIPYGETMSYGEIARRMAAKKGETAMASQAVGGAVGHNPISIIIPCHRVVGANGSLTGYAGGMERKIQLLRHEGADLSRLFIPAKGTAL